MHISKAEQNEAKLSLKCLIIYSDICGTMPVASSVDNMYFDHFSKFTSLVNEFSRSKAKCKLDEIKEYVANVFRICPEQIPEKDISV